MNISPTLQRTLSRSALQLQKYSPQILTAVGIAGLVTAGVLAAKNTLKLESTLDTARERLEDVKSEEEHTQKDVNRAVAKNVVDLGKLYWVPVTLATGSVVAILVGHNILHKRNLALVAAYKGLEQAFSEYRKRVIEEYGEEKDEKFRYGVRDVVTVDEETGKKTKSQEVTVPASDYIFSFGPENDNWNGKHEHNLFFVTRFQNIFNDKLQAHGHVFLNEVLDALGIERTKAGAVTGWVWKAGSGDDFIDFGIKDWQDSNGYILLDFNVDGVILDLI
ncbi:hypothetical protein PBI_COUNT_71 [Microbacterium phage Count]|nr:hypothetical protein PBI_COUNT_71 [Microbacterium phage Count]